MRGGMHAWGRGMRVESKRVVCILLDCFLVYYYLCSGGSRISYKVSVNPKGGRQPIVWKNIP